MAVELSLEIARVAFKVMECMSYVLAKRGNFYALPYCTHVQLKHRPGQESHGSALRCNLRYN